jgi:hypothetical protein
MPKTSVRNRRQRNGSNSTTEQSHFTGDLEHLDHLSKHSHSRRAVGCPDLAVRAQVREFFS